VGTGERGGRPEKGKNGQPFRSLQREEREKVGKEYTSRRTPRFMGSRVEKAERNIG